ncbi:methyltransferase [Vibrio sp. WJH972]
MDYRSLFVYLDSYLAKTESLWRYQPFQHMTQSDDSSRYPWRDEYLLLSDFLNSISDHDIVSHRQQSGDDWLHTLLPELIDVRHAARFPISSKVDDSYSIEQQVQGLINGIPGRKAAQLDAMVNAVVRRVTKAEQWLEWCSGKGYLGRLLASHTKKKVVSFEYQATLCDAGRAFAKQHLLPITFVQGDALLPSAKKAIHPSSHALALHACGDLHIKLIQYGTELNLPALTVAPCCYHLIQSDRFMPISDAYQRAQVKLTREELRIPLQQTVTGGERVKRHRKLEMMYRIGVDMIFRKQCGDQEYTPLPSIKKSMLAEGFEHFVRWAADYHSRAIGECDFNDYISQAEKKFYQMERISLVQQQFYPILEAWIVLDKVLYLQEYGYDVSVEQFCSSIVTPRNLLIHAQL